MKTKYLPLLFLIISSWTFAHLDDAHCLNKRKKLKMTKARTLKVRSIERETGAAFDINDLFSESIDSNLLDEVEELQIGNLTQFNRAPVQTSFWTEEESERHAQRLMAFQTTRSLLTLLRNSDVRYEYQSIESGFRSFSEMFSYSVIETPDGITADTNQRGRELVRFNLKLGLSNGADPQINFGPTCRLRYDWTRSSTLLEYGFDF